VPFAEFSHLYGACYLLCWCVNIITILQIYFMEILTGGIESKIV